MMDEEGIPQARIRGAAHMDVYCVGMYRAGSTWQYDIACHLLERHRGATRLGFLTGDLYAAKCADEPPQPGLWRVLKTHDGDERLAREIREGRAIGLYSYRDLRDVAFSLMHKASLDFGEFERRGFPRLLLDNDRFWRDQPRMLVQRYERLVAEPADAIAAIASFLGVVLRPGEAASVAEEHSLEANRRRTEGLAAQLSSQGHDLSQPGNQLLYDPHTLLHWNHLRQGTVGGWRDEADADRRRDFAALFGPWLIERGYESDPDWWRREAGGTGSCFRLGKLWRAHTRWSTSMRGWLGRPATNRPLATASAARPTAD
jgi:hypothetical protein